MPIATLPPAADQAQIDLWSPVEIAGSVVSTIIVRRIAPLDIAAHAKRYQDALQAGAPIPARLPMFFTPDGEPVPERVMQRLDLADAVAAHRAMVGFLPAYLKSAYALPGDASHG